VVAEAHQMGSAGLNIRVENPLLILSKIPCEENTQVEAVSLNASLDDLVSVSKRIHPVYVQKKRLNEVSKSLL